MSDDAFGALLLFVALAFLFILVLAGTSLSVAPAAIIL